MSGNPNHDKNGKFASNSGNKGLPIVGTKIGVTEDLVNTLKSNWSSALKAYGPSNALTRDRKAKYLKALSDFKS